MIWFLVLFPILVLFIFYLLVTRHHRKLYAPSDYKDEKFFVTLLPEEVIQKRVEEEVSEAAIAQQILTTEPINTKLSQATTQTLKASYLEAEKLAFKALEQDLGFFIQEQVLVKESHYKFEFDGFAIVKKTLHFFEVKYFQRPIFKREFIEAALHKVASVAFSSSVFDSDKYDNVVFHLGVVVGFRDETIEEFAKKLKSRIRSELFAVEYHFYDLEDLRRKFDKNA